MKVLCKKSYKEFIKYNWYEVDIKNHTYFDNGNIDSYFILSLYIDVDDKYGRRFVLDNWKLHSHPKFSTYFYTPKEMRLKKLKKINNVKDRKISNNAFYK